MIRDPSLRDRVHRGPPLRQKQLAQDLRRSLALILAGGVGSRLNVLVHHRAKPAVPFGAIYRIIDFSLSSVMNSGLERVGILTQYLPYSLTDHVGNGEAWGLIGRSREVKILPPHQGTEASDWYQGTADAVYQNLSYIERHDPELVVVLSGDHVYSMDYAALIAHHLESGADATIAVRTVPMEEASSFGTVHVDRDSWVTGFEEKPEKPVSNLISMGIYVFTTKALVRRLVEITGAGRGTDFGHHIFPIMLAEGSRLSTFLWDGYWQDVGTLRAYFDAHMDLIHPGHPLDLRSWGIRTNLEEHRLGDRPAALVSASGSIRQSYMARGCRIEGDVLTSVLGPGVVIEPGAVVRSSILMHDCQVGAGAVLENVILDKQVVVGAESNLGAEGDLTPNERFPGHLDSGISLIGKNARLPARTRLGRNVVVFPQNDLSKLGVRSVESGETIEVSETPAGGSR